MTEKQSGNGNKDSLFGMTYVTWKERQTNGSLFEKTLSLKSKKYCSAMMKNKLYQFQMTLVFTMKKTSEVFFFG